MAHEPTKLSLKLTYGRIAFNIYLPALSLARVLNKILDLLQYLTHKGIINVAQKHENLKLINAFVKSYNIIYGKADEETDY